MSKRPLLFLCSSGRSKKKNKMALPMIGWHIFDFFSEIAERNSTKLHRKQDLNVLYQVCVFRADQKYKIAVLAADWPTHIRLLLWSRLTQFNDNYMTRCKIANVFYQVFVFGPISKRRCPPRTLIGWDIFDFFSETAERNSTKLDKKQDLNVLYHVCVFQADCKNKMTAQVSNLLTHIRLLLWNCSTEFGESWQEARSRRLLSVCRVFLPIGKTRLSPWPLIDWDIFDFSSDTAEENLTKIDGKQDLYAPYQVCVFMADLQKTRRPPWSLIGRYIFVFCLKPHNGIQRNLAGSKISKSSTKFIIFGEIGKTKWPPWPIRKKGGILYSGARYVAFWASCFLHPIYAYNYSTSVLRSKKAVFVLPWLAVHFTR